MIVEQLRRFLYPTLILLLAVAVGSATAGHPADIPIPDEDDEQSASGSPSSPFWDNIQLNGKFDATFDFAQKDHPRAKHNGNSLANWSNYHSFLFLNVRFPPDVTFLGTIYVGERNVQHFFQVERRITRNLRLAFGRILVPFGYSNFHRFYGGVGGYVYESKMVPSIWAEPGINFQYREELARGLDVEGDTYFIRRSPATHSSVVLSSSASDKAGIGQRVKFVILSYTTVWGSAFYDTYDNAAGDHMDELLYGADIRHDFSWLGVPYVRSLVVTAGFASLNRDDAFDFGDFRSQYYGDYVRLTMNCWSRVRPQLTYGTFANDSFTEPDVSREHHFVASVTIPDGNLSYLIQYQRNWEDTRGGAAQREDDLLRVQLLFEF